MKCQVQYVSACVSASAEPAVRLEKVLLPWHWFYYTGMRGLVWAQHFERDATEGRWCAREENMATSKSASDRLCLPQGRCAISLSLSFLVHQMEQLIVTLLSCVRVI